MPFSVKTQISSCPSLQEFFENWNVGPEDLIITNEYLISPKLNGKAAPCGLLFQEKYGRSEPNDEMIDAMLKDTNGKDYSRVIAVGGGTVIDIAKLFVFGSGLTCQEIFDKGAKLPRKRSLIVIPTTCGTGSEVTNISIVEFKTKHTKIGLAVPALFADEAVLIPELLDTMPYDVFASSSIDALIHAVESYVSPKADAFTRALGGQAIRIIINGYKDQVNSGEKNKLPKYMKGFLEASSMAGIAFGNAGCGAVHALSYPIGAVYHVPHGKANYLVFEAVFSAYKRLSADLSGLEDVIRNALDCSDMEDTWAALFRLIDGILERGPLSALGIDAAKCSEMSESVINNQQRLLKNNPIPLSREDIKNIYLNCL